jgi:Dolichyl-phosphate-mannose-protein mannosyltransferase
MTTTQDSGLRTQDSVDSGLGRLRTQDFLRWWPEAAGALVVLISRLLTMPRTFWESDELLFAAALRRFDPWSSHPHPPGFPLYVGFGKLFDAILGDPFRALVALSVISCVVGFIALAAVFRHCLGDRGLGIWGALIFYFSAAMLVHGTLPLSDSVSVMFIALALWTAALLFDDTTRRMAIGFGLACSAVIGTRPQNALVVLPLFIAMLVWGRDVRKAAAAIISFGVLSLAWFLPLMDAAGGWSKLLLWETGQAAYVAAHDAGASRGAKSTTEIVARFLSHPWGPKWLAAPVLVLAILGIVALFRRPKRPLIPLAFFSAAYFVLAVAIMDPADAARYSLPHMMGMALLIAAGLDVVRRAARMAFAPALLATLLAIASLGYTAPLLGVRASKPSPPVAASEFIERSMPRTGVVLYDLSLRPQAEYLLGHVDDLTSSGGYRTAAIENGLREYYDRPDVPLVIYADGGSAAPDAHVFSWPESDVYGKLTRDHFRVVTVDPLRPAERYLPLAGVYALERNEAGEEWRWLRPDATLRLPHGGAKSLYLKLAISHDAPYEANTTRLLANGQEVGRAVVTKSGVEVTVPLPNAPQIDFRLISEQSFSPATVLHNQDPRILAVQLVRLETR